MLYPAPINNFMIIHRSLRMNKKDKSHTFSSAPTRDPAGSNELHGSNRINKNNYSTHYTMCTTNCKHNCGSSTYITSWECTSINKKNLHNSSNSSPNHSNNSRISSSRNPIIRIYNIDYPLYSRVKIMSEKFNPFHLVEKRP